EVETPIDTALTEGARPRPAPATFAGIQETPEGMADIELWNLTEPVGNHPVNSTVDRATLERAGFEVPPAPVTEPVAEQTAARDKPSDPEAKKIFSTLMWLNEGQV